MEEATRLGLIQPRRPTSMPTSRKYFGTILKRLREAGCGPGQGCKKKLPF